MAITLTAHRSCATPFKSDFDYRLAIMEYEGAHGKVDVSVRQYPDGFYVLVDFDHWLVESLPINRLGV